MLALTISNSPQSSGEARNRTDGFVAGAVEEGAVVVAGGCVPELDSDLRDGHFYAPTILLSEDRRIRAAQEEIFGPVVTVIPFGDENEAVEIANDVPFGSARPYGHARSPARCESLGGSGRERFGSTTTIASTLVRRGVASSCPDTAARTARRRSGCSPR